MSPSFWRTTSGAQSKSRRAHSLICVDDGRSSTGRRIDRQAPDGEASGGNDTPSMRARSRSSANNR